jgi:hypothetical protein
LRGVANRVDQATTNFLETFPLFAALVFVARVTGHHSLLTIPGAHFYFWGRLGYLLAAVGGFILVRSVLCWNIAVIGILLLAGLPFWRDLLLSGDEGDNRAPASRWRLDREPLRCVITSIESAVVREKLCRAVPHFQCNAPCIGHYRQSIRSIRMPETVCFPRDPQPSRKLDRAVYGPAAPK